MTFPIPPAEYPAHAEHGARRREVLVPDTPTNRYSIAAMEVFEETMRDLAAGWQFRRPHHTHAQETEVARRFPWRRTMTQ